MVEVGVRRDVDRLDPVHGCATGIGGVDADAGDGSGALDVDDVGSGAEVDLELLDAEVLDAIHQRVDGDRGAGTDVDGREERCAAATAGVTQETLEVHDEPDRGDTGIDVLEAFDHDVERKPRVEDRDLECVLDLIGGHRSVERNGVSGAGHQHFVVGQAELERAATGDRDGEHVVDDGISAALSHRPHERPCVTAGAQLRHVDTRQAADELGEEPPAAIGCGFEQADPHVAEGDRLERLERGLDGSDHRVVIEVHVDQRRDIRDVWVVADARHGEGQAEASDGGVDLDDLDLVGDRCLGAVDASRPGGCRHSAGSRERAGAQHGGDETDVGGRDLTDVRAGQGAAEADDVDAADAAAGDADLVDPNVADADPGERLERRLYLGGRGVVRKWCDRGLALVGERERAGRCPHGDGLDLVDLAHVEAADRVLGDRDLVVGQLLVVVDDQVVVTGAAVERE